MWQKKNNTANSLKQIHTVTSSLHEAKTSKQIIKINCKASICQRVNSFTLAPFICIRLRGLKKNCWCFKITAPIVCMAKGRRLGVIAWKTSSKVPVFSLGVLLVSAMSKSALLGGGWRGREMAGPVRVPLYVSCLCVDSPLCTQPFLEPDSLGSNLSSTTHQLRRSHNLSFHTSETGIRTEACASRDIARITVIKGKAHGARPGT